MNWLSDAISLGSNLRNMRVKRGISQEELCAMLRLEGCDVGRSTYAKYEMGVLNIRICVLAALRRIYHCKYEAFFEGMYDENG